MHFELVSQTKLSMTELNMIVESPSFLEITFDGKAKILYFFIIKCKMISGLQILTYHIHTLTNQITMVYTICQKDQQKVSYFSSK